MRTRERYRFSRFTVDADERRLTRGCEHLTLPPKAFDVLLALVRHAGRLVTKRDLLQVVWPDSFVEEGILAVHVSALRKLLDDPAEACRSIETVSRSGYRFRGDVTRVIDAAATNVGNDQLAAVQRGVVVLPFVNLSGDPDCEYFSDGQTEDIDADGWQLDLAEVRHATNPATFWIPPRAGAKACSPATAPSYSSALPHCKASSGCG